MLDLSLVVVSPWLLLCFFEVTTCLFFFFCCLGCPAPRSAVRAVVRVVRQAGAHVGSLRGGGGEGYGRGAKGSKGEQQQQQLLGCRVCLSVLSVRPSVRPLRRTKRHA